MKNDISLFGLLSSIYWILNFFPMYIHNLCLFLFPLLLICKSSLYNTPKNLVLCHMFWKCIYLLSFHFSFFSTHKFLLLAKLNLPKFSFVASGFSFCLERLSYSRFFLQCCDFHDLFKSHIWTIVKSRKTLWGSWAWKLFKNSCYSGKRGCRGKRGAVKKQYYSLEAGSWFYLKWYT